MKNDCFFHNISIYSHFYEKAQRSQEEILSIREQFLLPLNHLVDLLDIQSHVFHIIAPLDPSIGEDSLGNGTGAQCHNGLFLLHDEDVVQSVFAGTGVAGVLKVA